MSSKRQSSVPRSLSRLLFWGAGTLFSFWTVAHRWLGAVATAAYVGPCPPGGGGRGGAVGSCLAAGVEALLMAGGAVCVVFYPTSRHM